VGPEVKNGRSVAPGVAVALAVGVAVGVAVRVGDGVAVGGMVAVRVGVGLEVVFSITRWRYKIAPPMPSVNKASTIKAFRMLFTDQAP
jgi:hypothetical protein